MERSIGEIIDRVMRRRPGAMPASEVAYRRGCHQAAAWIYDQLGGCETLAEARELVGRAEDALGELRRTRRPAPRLLHEAGAMISRKGRP
ncbi:MAG: hypothetical protein U0797_26275 [Gemmataceae bacterium]